MQTTDKGSKQPVVSQDDAVKYTRAASSPSDVSHLPAHGDNQSKPLPSFIPSNESKCKIHSWHPRLKQTSDQAEAFTDKKQPPEPQSFSAAYNSPTQPTVHSYPYYYYGYYGDVNAGYPSHIPPSYPPWKHEGTSDTNLSPQVLENVPTSPLMAAVHPTVTMGLYYSTPVYSRPVLYSTGTNIPFVSPYSFGSAVPGLPLHHESNFHSAPYYPGPGFSQFVYDPQNDDKQASSHFTQSTEDFPKYTYPHSYYGYSVSNAPSTSPNDTHLPLHNHKDTAKKRSHLRRRASETFIQKQSETSNAKRCEADTPSSPNMTYDSSEKHVEPHQEDQNKEKSLGAASETQLQGARSDFVMWCGNVPSDATLEELWDFFGGIPNSYQALASSETVAGNTGRNEEARIKATNSAGILSIFIISRSSCAFINYATPQDLERACSYFQDKPLREKPTCPRLVCRPRKLEDAEYAGVAAQRGKGVHTNWFRERLRAEREELGASESLSEDHSFTSTNSSLLRQPQFSHRFFILKSRSHEALDTALRSSVWSTQSHNEPVLDQAFRNSETVSLFFSENFSGHFFGHAVMNSRPGETSIIPEQRKDGICMSEQSSEVDPPDVHGKGGDTKKRPVSVNSVDSNTPSETADRAAQEDLAVAAQLRNLRLEQFSEANLPNSLDDAVGSEKVADNTTTKEPAYVHEPRALQVGQPFLIEWKITKPLPFSEIQSLRNPWRDNRLVKVSRDGTELEPQVGRQLLAIWEHYASKA